jgi:hypothetical protein
MGVIVWRSVHKEPGKGKMSVERNEQGGCSETIKGKARYRLRNRDGACAREETTILEE